MGRVIKPVVWRRRFNYAPRGVNNTDKEIFEMADAVKTLNVMRDEVYACASEVVKAMNDHRPQKEIKELKKACTAAVNQYNDHVAQDYYRKLASNHGQDAVKVALEAKETAVPDVMGISFKLSDDEVARYEQTTPVIKLNLAKMQNTIGKEYFHEPDWFSRVSVLARLMAFALNEELGGGSAFQYAIDEAAKEFKLSENADPTSATSMVKAFQKVIDGILWVGDAVDKKGNPVNGIKFEKKHWAYITQCMSRQGSSIGEVLYGSPAKTTELVADSINMILTNKGPTLKTM